MLISCVLVKQDTLCSPGLICTNHSKIIKQIIRKIVNILVKPFLMACSVGLIFTPSIVLAARQESNLNSSFDSTILLASMTNKEARAAATALGYIEVKNELIKGQLVFKNPKKNLYISADAEGIPGAGGHNGGVWKMADSIANLAKRETRLGTFDANLNRIGD